MSFSLVDNHGRKVNYVRLAVTDRCNLRCFYCMPESGIDYLPRKDLLTYEEMTRMVTVLVGLGISKLRITGGEPFLRKDMMAFLRMLSSSSLEQINITTNGTLTYDVIPELKNLGINSVNLSLDTLDRDRFKIITRRDELPTVMRTFDRLQSFEIDTKINMVVMAGKNDQDVLSMAELARDHPITVRYIEEMPFNGSGQAKNVLLWDHRKILDRLREKYPELRLIPSPASSTSTRYQIPGFKGKVGIIAAYSRTFCGTCNRLRITPQGMLRTCLYAHGVFNIRDMIRQGASDDQLREMIINAVNSRARDGFEAEGNRGNQVISESMSTIGG